MQVKSKVLRQPDMCFYWCMQLTVTYSEYIHTRLVRLCLKVQGSEYWLVLRGVLAFHAEQRINSDWCELHSAKICTSADQSSRRCFSRYRGSATSCCISKFRRGMAQQDRHMGWWIRFKQCEFRRGGNVLGRCRSKSDWRLLQNNSWIYKFPCKCPVLRLYIRLYLDLSQSRMVLMLHTTFVFVIFIIFTVSHVHLWPLIMMTFWLYL